MVASFGGFNGCADLLKKVLEISSATKNSTLYHREFLEALSEVFHSPTPALLDTFQKVGPIR
jgi:hypothetical protein